MSVRSSRPASCICTEFEESAQHELSRELRRESPEAVIAYIQPPSSYPCLETHLYRCGVMQAFPSMRTLLSGLGLVWVCSFLHFPGISTALDSDRLAGWLIKMKVRWSYGVSLVSDSPATVAIKIKEFGIPEYISSIPARSSRSCGVVRQLLRMIRPCLCVGMVVVARCLSR